MTKEDVVLGSNNINTDASPVIDRIRNPVALAKHLAPFLSTVFHGDVTEGEYRVARADDATMDSRDPATLSEFILGSEGEAFVSMQTRHQDSGQAYEQAAVAFYMDDATGAPPPSIVVRHTDGSTAGIWLLTEPADATKIDDRLTTAAPIPGVGGWAIASMETERVFELDVLEKAFAPATEQAAEPSIIVHGTLDPELLQRPLALTLSPHGSKTSPGRWRDWQTTVGEFLNIITVHKPGEKDGNCFLQGAVVGGERRANAVKTLDLMILDLDTGESLDALRQKVMDLGLACLLYTTHSNLKSVSQIKKDDVVRWQGESVGEITTETVCAYLMDEKRYQPHVLDGAKLLGTEHTSEGIKLNVSHQPMEKFRLVLFLSEQFVVADRANTQREAIQEWKELYAGLSKKLGAFYDRSCVDPSRLFFTPRHPKGSNDWRVEVVAGKLLDLSTVERLSSQDAKREAKGAFAAAAAEMASTSGATYKTENLKRFFAKHGAGFDLETWLLEVDPDGDRGSRANGPGRTHRCPADDSHSNAGDEEDAGFFCVNGVDSPTGQAIAKCMHDSCADLDRLNFVDLICERVGMTDAMGLVKWCGEITEEKSEQSETGNDADNLLRFRTFDEAKTAIDALRVGDDGGKIVRQLAVSRFKPMDLSRLKRMLSKQIGAGIRDIEAEMKGVHGAGGTKRKFDLPHETIAAFEAFSAEWSYVAEGHGVFVKFLPDGELEIKAVDALIKHYAHEIVTVKDADGENTQKPLVPEWLKWQGSASSKFHGLRFLPGKDDIAPYMNTYRGLGVVPKPGSWELLKQHIFEVLCSRNDRDYKRVIGFMAHVLQHVGDVKAKLSYSLVVHGVEGAGKSLVFDYFRQIFGPHGIALSKAEQIVGRFNASLAQGLVVLLEEAIFSGDPRIDGPLKDLLTGRTINIERKGLDPVQSPNFAHFVIISNSPRAVAVTGGSRRYYIIECSDEKANDQAWFKPIIDEMEHGGLEAMAWDLLRWAPEDGEWSFLSEFPRTEAGDRMIAERLSPMERFMLQWAFNGGCGFGFGSPGLSETDEVAITAGQLATAFQSWVDEEGNVSRRERDGLKTDTAAVGLTLRKMFPLVAADHTREGNRRLFPSQGEVIKVLRTHQNGGYRAYLDTLAEGG